MLGQVGRWNGVAASGTVLPDPEAKLHRDAHGAWGEHGAGAYFDPTAITATAPTVVHRNQATKSSRLSAHFEQESTLIINSR